MTGETPTANYEKEARPDDARKFVVAGALDMSFLEGRQALAFDIDSHWTDVTNTSEQKVVHRTRVEDGTTQNLLIGKVKKPDGGRDAIKKKIDDSDYEDNLQRAKLASKKRRYEFQFIQGGTVFTLKYDVFKDRDLLLLEVDADVPADRAQFDPESFPYPLEEILDGRYDGWRVALPIDAPKQHAE